MKISKFCVSIGQGGCSSGHLGCHGYTNISNIYIHICHNHFKFFFHSDGQDIESQQRWYYDSSDGTCKEFDYLGKKGNGNRFLTRQDCQASCQPSQVEREKANYLYYLQKEF